MVAANVALELLLVGGLCLANCPPGWQYEHLPFESRRAHGAIVVTSIFISHSSQDADGALRLAEDLKRTGLEVWLDEWEIAVGDRIT